jgi:hypothetical protein
MQVRWHGPTLLSRKVEEIKRKRHLCLDRVDMVYLFSTYLFHCDSNLDRPVVRRLRPFARAVEERSFFSHVVN